MKKLVSIFLLLALVIFQVDTIKVFADTQSGDFKYTVSGTTAEITKYTGSGEIVVIPSKIDGYIVTSINDFAFKDYSSLTSITIPSSVTSIGDFAFTCCSSLTNITIPDSVTSIGNSAFKGCSSLTIITIPNSITSIGNGAFMGCSSLTSITIPNSITSIGYGAFYNCSSLTSITIPNSVTSIASDAFYDCSKLSQINVNDNNTNYSSLNGVLYNKDKTTLICYPSGKPDLNFTIPNSVTSIYSIAFLGYSNLSSIDIPSSVTNINNNTFADCLKLSQINVNDNNTNYSSLNGILYNKDKTTLIYYPSGKTDLNFTIPDSVTSIDYDSFHRCTKLSQINVNDNNTNYSSLNGVLYNKDKTTLICYPTGKTNSNFIIPDSVINIGKNSFSDCSNLSSITIPNSVSSIDAFTFAGCSSLTNITIPNSVSSINNYAFYCCSKLTSITIPNSVSSISFGTFEDCSSLTSITIPSSVTRIDEDVFDGCPSALTIYYHNTAIGFTNPWYGYKTVSCNIVSYNGNGNTSGTVPVDNNVYAPGYKSSILNNTGSLVKTGYVFAGWNTAADGSGTSYPAGSSISMNGTDITLYAQWKIQSLSPSTGTFIKAEPNDLTTAITAPYKAVNPVTGVYNGTTKLIDGTDETLTDTNTGYTLTLYKSYLSTLTTSNTVIIVKFKDGSSLNFTVVNKSIPKNRIYGNDRFETAAEVSKKGWTTTSEFAVIATGEDYPDALCAAPLAKKYDAPIILTEKNKLSDAAKNELTRLSVKKVFIIGGIGAVSSNVETEINSLGITPTRIAGINRYDTSLKVAKQLGINNPPTAINIATGDNFADALSISSIAAMKGEPILLTSKDSINDDIKQYIQDNSSTITASYIIGGTGVISDTVANSLINPIRLSGKNRYETNKAVLNNFKNDLDISNVYLATGNNFPDALAASALAAKTKSPILLVDSSIDDSTKSFVNDNNNSIANITAVGGTGVISDDILGSF